MGSARATSQPPWKRSWLDACAAWPFRGPPFRQETRFRLVLKSYRKRWRISPIIARPATRMMAAVRRKSERDSIRSLPTCGNLKRRASRMEKSSTSFTTGFALRACLLLVGEPRADEADQDSWKLVHFIRRLPAITPDELEQMKEMNPRSPGN